MNTPKNKPAPMPAPCGRAALPNPDTGGTDLTVIPGIGANMARHLNNIGIFHVEDLVGKDPEELYQKNCVKKGYQDDRCVLYVFRCAVYFAENRERETEKLKWWYWKDREYPETVSLGGIRDGVGVSDCPAD